MLKKMAVTALFIAMTACSTVPATPSTPVVTVHPELPRPVFAPMVDWQILEVDGVYYVGTEFKNFSNILKYDQDVLRYIRQSKNALCSYRVDLNETFCTQEYNNEK